VEYGTLRALDAGCGVGPMTRWFARKGVRADGIDMSDVALHQCDFLNKKELLSSELRRIQLHIGGIEAMVFADETFDIVVEANTIQHMSKEDRQSAFNEIYRVLKPGGLFCAQQQGCGSTAYYIEQYGGERVEGDSSTYRFPEKNGTGYHLTSFQTHFFSKGEYQEILPPFSVKDVHFLEYNIPREEAKRRGYDQYWNDFYLLYCIK
jgi:ubiquinone/menaquinone biosynthesis C-methylase UbiE